jgi:hypothetical protein
MKSLASSFRVLCLHAAPVIAVLTITTAFSFDSAHAQKGGGGATAGQSQAGGSGSGSGGATPYFETEMLAYGAAHQLAVGIAQRACSTEITTNATIVIFDPGSFQNLGVWQSFSAGAQALEDAYKTVLTPTQRDTLNSQLGGSGLSRKTSAQAAGSTSSSASFIQGGSDLGSLITAIAASTTNNASTFTIQDSTMAVSLMHEFQRIHCNVRLVYYPLFGSYADLSPATDEVKSTLEELNRVRAYVQNTLGPTAIPQQQQDASQPQGQQLEGGQDASQNADPRIGIVTDLNTQYDLILKQFFTVSAQSGGGGQSGSGQTAGTQGAGQSSGAGSGGASTGYVSLLQGAELERLIQKSDTYILYADVATAGGTQRDVKNVFTLLTGDWLSYSGGLIANIALIKSSNTSLVFADTLRYRTNFTNYFGINSFKSPEQSELVENNNSGSNVINLCNQERHQHFFHRAVKPTDCDVSSTYDNPLQITGFQLNAKEIGGSGDTSVPGTITVNRAPDKNTEVAIQVTPRDSNLPERKLTVTIKAGNIAEPLAISIPGVTQKTDFTVSAKLNNRPGGEFALTSYPKGLFFQRTDIVGGEFLEATLVLAKPATSGSITITVSGSDGNIGAMSPVPVPKGSSLVHFEVPTKVVAAEDAMVVTATYIVEGATVNETATAILNPTNAF